jgi:uncharacterized membrane protein
MFSYRMARLSAMLTLLGSILIFYAFQATSTGFLVYTHGKHGESAMCIGDPPRSLIAMGPSGELLMAMRGYDQSCSQGRHFAVIDTESPRLACFGWILMLVGFILQMLSIEKPMSAKEDQKRLKKLRRLAA